MAVCGVMFEIHRNDTKKSLKSTEKVPKKGKMLPKCYLFSETYFVMYLTINL